MLKQLIHAARIIADVLLGEVYVQIVERGEVISDETMSVAEFANRWRQQLGEGTVLSKDVSWAARVPVSGGMIILVSIDSRAVLDAAATPEKAPRSPSAHELN